MNQARPSSPEANLPGSLTELIGRERDAATLRQLMRRPNVRLVTLTGPGGVGKTRLALQVAATLAGAFLDGVAFVSLAEVHDASFVLSTIGTAFDLRERGDVPMLETLLRSLRTAQLLLVLDNFEHVVEAAPLLTTLLDGCPSLAMLVTSRVRLRVSAEHVYVVAPLRLPRRAAAGVPEDPRRAGAVKLFMTRAVAVAPDLGLNSETINAITSICQQLDGLPLAIELAAARVRYASPATILAQLQPRLPMLTDASRTAPERQRTMRNTIAWSYDALPPPEQALFRRLAVFVGGFDLAAARAVGEDREEIEVLDGVASLLDHSLLYRQPEWDEEPRYLMLETIREFGLEQLTEHGEAGEVCSRHAAFYMARAEDLAGKLQRAPDPPAILSALVADLGNLRTALAWINEHGRVEDLVRCTRALIPFWYVHGQLREGRYWIGRWLERSSEGGPELRAAGLTNAGWFDRGLGDLQQATEFGRQGLALYQQLGDAPGSADALQLLGRIAEDQGAYTDAVAAFQRALALIDERTHPLSGAELRRDLGWASHQAGDAGGETMLETTLAWLRDRGLHYWATIVQNDLGMIALQRRDYQRAAALIRPRLALAWDAWSFRWAIEDLADVALACGELVRGVRLMGAAEAQRERLGTRLLPRQQKQLEASLTMIRASLGAARFAALWDEGRRMSTAEARAEAEQVAQPAAAAPAIQQPEARGFVLTRREREILRLLVEGHSNAGIAAALAISQRTAQGHVASILAKFDVSNRAAAAAYAVRHRLI